MDRSPPTPKSVVIEPVDFNSHFDEKPKPGNERRFDCPWPDCGKRFMRRTDVTRHMRIHLNDRPLKCDWEGCGKAFMQRSALKIHIRTHTGEKPNICPFEGCGKAFNDTSSLARHRRTHYSSDPYPCTQNGCHQRFPNRKALLAHEKTSHPEKKKLRILTPVDSPVQFDETSPRHAYLTPPSIGEFQSPLTGQPLLFDYQPNFLNRKPQSIPYFMDFQDPLSFSDALQSPYIENMPLAHLTPTTPTLPQSFFPSKLDTTENLMNLAGLNESIFQPLHGWFNQTDPSE